MKYIQQFLIIIAFSFLGEVLHFFIPLPVPASIYGILLLFTALMKKWIKINQVREVSTLLIAVMPIMFIPAAVGLIDSWTIMESHLLKYIIVTIVSTFIVMGTSGFITQYVIRRDNTKREKK